LVSAAYAEGGESMKISSSQIKAGKMIPRKYTCQGQNVNPPLEIGGVPENAKSLVILIEDPDAPMGTWTHWVVFNVPPTSLIPENTVPGMQAKNDFQRIEYGGPCPPIGTHRYFFKVFALDATLALQEGCSRMDVEGAMKGHILSQGEFFAIYQKS